MKISKKLLAFLLTAIMLLATACTSNNSPPTNNAESRNRAREAIDRAFTALLIASGVRVNIVNLLSSFVRVNEHLQNDCCCDRNPAMPAYGYAMPDYGFPIAAPAYGFPCCCDESLAVPEYGFWYEEPDLPVPPYGDEPLPTPDYGFPTYSEEQEVDEQWNTNQ